MPPQLTAAAQAEKGGGHAAGAAGEEAIGQAHPAAQLPQGQQTQEQRDLCHRRTCRRCRRTDRR